MNIVLIYASIAMIIAAPATSILFPFKTVRYHIALFVLGLVLLIYSIPS
jgi:hypothetical protein